ncbi:MAG: bile acid:sodium symporter family protein [Pirellulales bacterium]|jgi:BASS family bile acid:Na+ symporter
MKYFERLLLVWLCASSALALYWVELFGEATFDPFVWGKPALNYVVMVTMFCIGWLLPRKEIDEVARRWPTVLGGTVVQYLSMPLLALLVCILFGIEGDLRLGILMAGCVPGAMASNVLTLFSKGNVSYSVGLTTSATLLSPLIVPVALGLLSSFTGELPLSKMSVTLLWTVVGPVLAGHLVGRSLPRYEHVAKVVGSLVANLAILWIIAVIVGLTRDKIAAASVGLILPLLLMNLLGYAAGYSGGKVMKLPNSMRRALTLEVGLQNAGLGTMLTLTVLNNEEAAIPTALYMFGCMLTGTILATFWSMKDPSDETDEVTAAQVATEGQE